MKTASEAIESVRDQKRLSILEKLQILDTPAEEAFDRLTRLATKITNSPVSLLSLVDADRQFFKSMFGLADPTVVAKRETPLSHSFCKHVVADNQPLIVTDARTDPILKENLAIPDLDVISYLGMPLNSSDGVTLGSFCIIDSKPRIWSDKEIEIVRELAASAMTEIELRAQIEERKQIENALREAKAQAEAANRAKSAFLASMSHEFRTPLAAIIGYSELLLEQDEEKAIRDISNFLIKIKIVSNHLLALIGDTLDLAKIEAGEMALHIQPFDLISLVKELPASLQPLLDKNKTILTLKLPTQHLIMINDPNRLRQILLNLLNNAAKFTVEGTICLIVQAIANKHICFRVQDNGIGMTEEQMERLFEPFTQVDTSEQANVIKMNRYKGSGLGLMITKQLCQLMGGKVESKSEKGVGSTFTVTLPLEYSSDPTASLSLT